MITNSVSSISHFIPVTFTTLPSSPWGISNTLVQVGTFLDRYQIEPSLQRATTGLSSDPEQMLIACLLSGIIGGWSGMVVISPSILTNITLNSLWGSYMKKQRFEVVWVPRDHMVQDLINQYLNKEIDYLALTTAFRKNGWSIAGLFEIIQSFEYKKELEKKIVELKNYDL
jgi:hypothetical protein